MSVWTVGRPVGKIIRKILIIALKAELKLKLNFSTKLEQPQLAVNSLRETKEKYRNSTHGRIGDCSFLAFHMDANFCRHITFPYEIKRRHLIQSYCTRDHWEFYIPVFWWTGKIKLTSHRYISLPFVKGPHSNCYLDRSHVESRYFLPLGHFTGYDRQIKASKVFILFGIIIILFSLRFSHSRACAHFTDRFDVIGSQISSIHLLR